ncbi:MAG: hypothetical protein AB8W37_11210 [Arsenophonus endosymbiont of Dermacentor nuttalli]
MAKANLAFYQFIFASSPEIFTLKHCIGTVVECVVDEPDNRTQLTENLHNTSYSSKNLRTIENDSDSSRFIAHFENSDLTFTNRATTK